MSNVIFVLNDKFDISIKFKMYIEITMYIYVSFECKNIYIKLKLLIYVK